MQREVRALAAERNAVILAHNYQRPEVQDVADVVGDSLGLSRQAAATDADAIVFCGVHFMAETAKILAPDRTVLIPDPAAGCSLADTITAEQLRAWKAQFPGAAVVAYVNTTADVNAIPGPPRTPMPRSTTTCPGLISPALIAATASSREW